MTAVLCWSTFDGHGTASVYFATDSRFSFLSNGTCTRYEDESQKTFACSETPDIFAVCGTVTRFSELCPALIDSVRELRKERVRDEVDDSDYSREVVYQAGKRVDLLNQTGLTLFHAFRFDKLRFGVTRIVFGRDLLFAPAVSYFPVTLTASTGMLFVDGHGAEMIRRQQNDDPETDAKGFSRWFWQSFVMSLNSPTDKTCGGAPQLVGLYRRGNGLQFGVHFNGSVFLKGGRLDRDPTEEAIEYRDELFQRSTFSRQLVDNAQRHARNFPGRNLLNF